MSGSLSGKVALVTGAGQGVGQGIAFALAAEGARIAVTGRTLSRLEDTCAEIRRRGGEALPVECNVRSLSSLQRCVEAVVDHFSGIQILVNNAQEVPNGPLNQVSDELFMAGLESGPMATFRMMMLCYPPLKSAHYLHNHDSTASQ